MADDALPTPYKEAKDGQILFAKDWNDIQGHTRKEIHVHDHSGDENGNSDLRLNSLRIGMADDEGPPDVAPLTVKTSAYELLRFKSSLDGAAGRGWHIGLGGGNSRQAGISTEGKLCIGSGTDAANAVVAIAKEGVRVFGSLDVHRIQGPQDPETGLAFLVSESGAANFKAGLVVGQSDETPGEGGIVASGDIETAGCLATQGGRVWRDFLSWKDSPKDRGGEDNRYAPGKIRIQTSMRAYSGSVYRFVVEGYNLQAKASVRSEVVGYLKKDLDKGEDPIRNGSADDYAPGAKISQRINGKGFLCLDMLCEEGMYRMSFAVSAWFERSTAKVTASVSAKHKGEWCPL